MKPWIGAARPAPFGAMLMAAEKIGCDVPAILAVWEVEAAGREFRKDGSLTRRFEPHKMPGSRLTWRDSLAMPEARRWELFDEGYKTNPRATLLATSWGAPQIMGENFLAAGYASVEDMVKAMADHGSAQVLAFVAFVIANGLDAHIRAHDWYKFSVGYNGTGKPEAYAKDLEAAYRRHSGKTSPVILRFGAQGASVSRIQRVIGAPETGVFDAATNAAVRSFQSNNGLVSDGIVGFKTWEVIRRVEDNRAYPGSQPAPPPPAQPTRGDELVENVSKWSAAVTAASAAAAGARELFDDAVWQAVGYGLVAGGLIFVGAVAVKMVRK